MDDIEILPPSSAEDFRLDADSVHLWSLSLRVSPASLDRLAPLLDSAEQRRAKLFHFDRDRRRFIVGRAALRNILGRYLRAEPADLRLEYSPRGKPFLPTGSALHFNFAHCEDLAVLAMTRRPNVGVDLERVRPVEGALEMAAFFCSPDEYAQFQSVPALEKETAFFRLWTRKEALLKATGHGIGDALNKVEVSFRSDDPPRLIRMPEELAILSSRWSLQEFKPADGFLAVVARPGPPAILRCRQWKEEEMSIYA
jgi:4'-phosphopantetheinyl transferase